MRVENLSLWRISYNSCSWWINQITPRSLLKILQEVSPHQGMLCNDEIAYPPDWGWKWSPASYWQKSRFCLPLLLCKWGLNTGKGNPLCQNSEMVVIRGHKTGTNLSINWAAHRDKECVQFENSLSGAGFRAVFLNLWVATPWSIGDLFTGVL